VDFSSLIYIKVNVADIPDQSNQYWLSNHLVDFDKDDTTRVIDNSPFYVNTESNIPDKFNADYDNLDGNYSYSRYLRFDDLNFENEETEISYYFHYQFVGAYSDLNRLKPPQSLFVELINGSNSFDRYFKSSILEQDNYLNPFAEPVYIYSNINNGVGIFAGYNSRISVIK